MLSDSTSTFDVKFSMYNIVTHEGTCVQILTECRRLTAVPSLHKSDDDELVSFFDGRNENNISTNLNATQLVIDKEAD